MSRTPPSVIAFTAGVFALSAVLLAPGPPRARAEGVAAISAGGEHTCAVTTAGGLKCWGNNASGQLGDGTTDSSSRPVDVSGLTSGVGSVSTGDDHTCAVTTAGGLKCWGSNASGQLGDGTIDSRSTPVEVSGLPSDVVAVSAGGLHTCALLADGSLMCWGNNFHGQLGIGANIDSHTPVKVAGIDGVSAVSAGSGYTCALTNSGGVKCWGENYYGQLGTGSTVPSTTPVEVAGLASGVSAIAAGGFHACALSTAGAVTCWGNNSRGQLGTGSTALSATPVDVSGLASGVLAISAGGRHTCAVTASGGAKCWGGGFSGQLGDSPPTDRYRPVDVTGMTVGVETISAGGHHTCAITAAGVLSCWGNDVHGQLGDGSNNDRVSPDQVLGLGPKSTPTPCPTEGCPAPTATPTPAAQPGDADCNAAVTNIDATLLLQLLAGLVSDLPCPGNADVNDDGQTNAVDAALILQYSAGLIQDLPP